MNKPVHTKTPGGEDVVILPAADYERLVNLAEDARDLALAEKALAAVKSGRGEVLTEPEMVELLGAPSPISFWRKRRSLTQAALGAAVGITQAYLAQIERGRRTGDLRLYRRLANALRVDIDDLLPVDDGDAPPRRKLAKRRKK
jgi:DNA-binding XRE family transcriptional regulator